MYSIVSELNNLLSGELKYDNIAKAKLILKNIDSDLARKSLKLLSGDLNFERVKQAKELILNAHFVIPDPIPESNTLSDVYFSRKKELDGIDDFEMQAMSQKDFEKLYGIPAISRTPQKYRNKFDGSIIDALQLLWTNWSEMCEFANVGKLKDGKPKGCYIGTNGEILPEGLCSETLGLRFADNVPIGIADQKQLVHGAIKQNSWIGRGKDNQLFALDDKLLNSIYEPLQKLNGQKEPIWSTEVVSSYFLQKEIEDRILSECLKKGMLKEEVRIIVTALVELKDGCSDTSTQL